MTERARILFRHSVQAALHDARNARGVFRPRAFGHAPVHRRKTETGRETP